MKTSTVIWVVVVILVLVGGWYVLYPPASTTVYNNTTPTATVPSTGAGLNGSPNQTNTGQPAVAPVLAMANSATLGNYLVASDGMTLYLYTKDTKGVSNCSGTCAVNWPPYLHTAPEPLMGATGVTGAITTIVRADGTAQVAYNGTPLYYFKNDAKVGDTLGQNVGGVWFILKP
jgi:predicted lipoprotein with Yx(FWY)xxD motif